MSRTVPRDIAARWLQRWDAQQQRYVADREERFTVLCDVLEAGLADVTEPVIVDLGCGPGSLSARLHERLPHARIAGVDSDPLLLGLARAHYGPGFDWVDADLATPSWTDRVPHPIHAAVSTTALHWLPTDRLGDLYRTVAGLLAPGGLLVNGDHLGLGDPRLDTLAARVRDGRAARVGVSAAEDWLGWWDAVLADPALAGLATERAARTGGDTQHHGNGLSLAGHQELLRTAGFTASAAVWQVGDDHVLVGVK